MKPDANDLVLGLELGSTRIKAVLINKNHTTVASGSYAWENRLENGVWTYHLDEVLRGVRGCYADLRVNAERVLGAPLRTLSAIGISGMMHGYLVFDEAGGQLAPFRTWRNTITGEAAAELTELFRFNIPQRYSIAHLEQAILNGEEHVGRIRRLTTLSGYIHGLLTGENVVGVGEASGMFPYDAQTGDFRADLIEKFDALEAGRGIPWKLRGILPRVLPAGAQAGRLLPESVRLLDETGTLEPGIPFCPPEGDAGTGMVATGCVLPRTASVSAGTSAFALMVLEKPLTDYYPEIDVVATPAGRPVAMAHTNTCTSEVDAWVRLFAQFAEATGQKTDPGSLFGLLYRTAMDGDPDCGGMLAYNYFSGEPVAKIPAGRPLFIRRPDSAFTLANFMRAQLYGAVATLKLGIDLLVEKEQVETDRIVGHGGFFKTAGAGQQILADALGAPVSVMETAGEGGPWGMALLAAYSVRRAPGESLEEYLARRVFADAVSTTAAPDPAGAEGFRRYMQGYTACLPSEAAAAALK